MNNKIIIVLLLVIIVNFLKADFFIDPYINNYVLNNISQNQIVEYLNIKDSENVGLSNIELGAKYILYINPPYDRELPEQIGERWQSLTQDEKNKRKVVWFTTYINSIDLNDLKKYIDIDNLIKRGTAEKEKFEKRQQLTEIDFSSITIPISTPKPSAQSVPEPPSQPARTSQQTTSVRSTPPRSTTPRRRRQPAAAKRQLPDTREKIQQEVKEEPEKEKKPSPEFLTPDIQTREKLKIPKIRVSTPVTPTETDFQTEIKVIEPEISVSEIDIERRELEERQRKVLNALAEKERLQVLERERELEAQLERRRELLEEFVNVEQEIQPVSPDKTQDDLLRDKILELDIQMTRDQIHQKEDYGFRRQMPGPPTTLSN